MAGRKVTLNGFGTGWERHQTNHSKSGDVAIWPRLFGSLFGGPVQADLILTSLATVLPYLGSGHKPNQETNLHWCAGLICDVRPV